MEQIARAIAVQELPHGGLLLHGALAVRDGVGAVLAGPSGIGKSTASRRLPLPWLSLCDDLVLVVRDTKGLYWAHPWPTWSLLPESGLARSWPAERAVPLKGLLFLSQSSLDRAEPVSSTPAAALILESAILFARTIASAPPHIARAVCAAYLRAARALASSVPAFRLHISLNGEFWREMDRALSESIVAGGRGDALVIRSREFSRPPSACRSSRLVCFDGRRGKFLKFVSGGEATAGLRRCRINDE